MYGETPNAKTEKLASAPPPIRLSNPNASVPENASALNVTPGTVIALPIR